VTDEADKPRMRIDYGSLQIHESRSHIRVVILKGAPDTVRDHLFCHGFKKRQDGAWERPNSPDTIFTAQAICKTFFPTSKETT
jgi:hypothetical protein